jgi:hypothetical protein
LQQFNAVHNLWLTTFPMSHLCFDVVHILADY